MAVPRQLRKVAGLVSLGGSLLLPLACREAAAGDGPSTTEVAAALRGLRLVEPRFSGGFDAGPCVQVRMRGRLLPAARCAPFPDPESWSGATLEKLVIDLAGRADDEGNRKARQANAVYGALFGATGVAGERGTAFLARALSSLEKLRDSQPQDPLLLNDLAATYFLQALARDDPAELVSSLDFSEQAYALAPESPEIRFNRALVLEQWGLVFAAREAWEEVAKEDSEEWAKEAKDHLAALGRPTLPERWRHALPELEQAVLSGDEAKVREIVEIDRQSAREYAMEEVLGGWGEKTLAGDIAGAGRDLAVARAVGEALMRAGGDRSLAAGVRILDQAGHSEARSRLARGHLALREGTRAYRNWQNGSETEPLFRAAVQDLSAVGSPIALWADELRARSISHQSRYEEALGIHREILEKVQKRGFPALEAFARWGHAWSLNRWRGPAFALPEEEASYRSATEAGEIENAGAVRSMVGDAYYRLGQGTAAYRHWYQALQLLISNPLSLRRHNTFLRLADQAYESGYERAALRFRREQLVSAGNDLVKQAEALYHLGTMLASSGRYREGLRESERAVALGDQVPQDGTGKKLVADIQANRGLILRHLDPARALAPLSQANDFFAADGGAKPDEVSNLAERALAFADLGRFAEARADLERAFYLLEERRRVIDGSDFRATFGEASQAYYDAAIEIEWRQNRDPGRALAVLERARGVEEAALPGGAAAALGSGDLPALARLLPPGSPVVIYAVLPRDLLIWTFDQGECRFAARAIESTRLAAEVRGYVDRIVRGAGQQELIAEAQKLGVLLLPEPLWKEPRSAPALILPDKALHRLPFASLRHPRTGKFFVEAGPFALAQSLASLLAPAVVHGTGFHFEAPALLVGNPAFDTMLLPGLDSLPGAEREIRNAARRFAGAKVLVGAEATKSAFLAGLEDAKTLIFSGHSVARADRPGQSFLALAPESALTGPNSGLLFAEEVSRLRLPHLRTVILSSCASAGPSDGRHAGFSGLARPFLDAGVEEVVGTLWHVRDGAQAQFLAQLFARLEEGRSLGDALQAVQVETLRLQRGQDSKPREWSMMEVFLRGRS